MDDTTLRPFFIIGHPRSGTTLLRLLVSSHPHLFVPAETGFLPFLDIDPREELDRQTVKDLLRRIGLFNRAWDDMVEDEERFYASLPRPAVPYILDALYWIKAPPGTTRWGDKTPLFIQYIPQILAVFPQAQFVHVIRDGRDAALSARAKWRRSKPYTDFSYALRNWVRNVQTGRAAAGLLDQNQYIEVRYETLVANPRDTLHSLFAFLGETFDPASMDFQALAHWQGSNSRTDLELEHLLKSSSVGRWRQEMTQFERRLAHIVAGPLLAELDYAPCADDGPLTVANRARLNWLSAKFLALDGLRTWLYRRRIRTLNDSRWQRP